MSSKGLTSIDIAKRNLQRRKGRTLCLAGIVALLSFVLAGGTLLSVCLENGISSITKRLGADMLLVPLGAEKNIEGALLRGEPSAFYLDGNTAQRLLALEGIKQASPQIFLASFDSPHCSSLVEMIGYDPATDFVIAPWLQQEIPVNPGQDEVVVGSNIRGDVGDTLKFFNRDYKVVGKLDETGMGFDVSVFVNLDMARIALQEYAAYAALSGQNVPEGEGTVSSITLNVKPGIDVAEFAKNVRIDFAQDRVAVVLPEAMISDFAGNMRILLVVIAVLAVLLWILAVGVLALLFSLSANERKREFGVFRVIGATQKKLVALLLTESVLTSFLGAAVGILLLAVLYFSFTPLIRHSADIPFLQPPGGIIALLLVSSFLLSFLTGPLASLYAAVRIGRTAVYAITREGE